MSKTVFIVVLAVLAVVLAKRPFREESCCKKPILTNNFRRNYYNWKSACGEKNLDGNCWAYCVFKKGSQQTNQNWNQMLQSNIQKEPSQDLEWKKGVIKNVIESCKNPNDLLRKPCNGTMEHIETLRCGLRIIENSCPQGMWNTTDPLCKKH